MFRPVFRSVLLAALTLLASCGSVRRPTAPALDAAPPANLSALAVNPYGECPLEGCTGRHDVFSFAPIFLNAMSGSPLVTGLLREASGSADISTALDLTASVVTSRWHWNSSSFQVMVPLRRDPTVILRFEMVGPGSSSKTSAPRPFDTGLVNSSVMLGRVDHSAYGYDRVIVVQAQKRVAHTLILSGQGKVIGADVDVPLAVRPMAQALPVGDPRLSAQPIAVVRTRRPPARALNMTDLTYDDVDPRCYQDQPNGGMNGQTIVVCPNPLPPRCPDLDTMSLTRANVTYASACAKPAPTTKPCPEIPRELTQALRNAEGTLGAASTGMIAAANGLATARLAFSQAGCGSPNPIDKAKCVMAIGSVVTAGAIFAVASYVLKNAIDQVSIAKAAIADWRSRSPCY
ncbi:hypothetical protein [Deinococcus pimensis]|uniref:hypothetical protein n=1 Tax=Deinococcus pimensis TaxID=309888 RepID=UPI000484C00A|nr:hypothetical protein [Deinococcus pimensis]